MQTFSQRAIALHGTPGRAWVEGIPATLAELREAWSLELAPPFPALSFNYVAPVRRRDGSDAVLKLAFPGDGRVATEVAALRLFDGCGAVRLLEVDLPHGAMLLERLTPGAPLDAEPDDAKATGVIAALLAQLWRPVPERHPFPSLADWAGGFDRLRARYGGTAGPLPGPLIDRAEQLFKELLASATDTAVLHGDLHHGNVLASRRQPWLAIDPKGVIGEPAYDTAAMLRNPLPALLSWPNVKRILRRRIDQLADELGFPWQRVHAWGLAQTVLAAVWSLEDEGTGWKPAIACAELLAQLHR